MVFFFLSYFYGAWERPMAGIQEKGEFRDTLRDKNHLQLGKYLVMLKLYNITWTHVALSPQTV